MNETGRKISLAIAAYMAAKPLINFFFLGGSLMPLVLGIAAIALMWFGVKGSNVVLAILLMLVACANLPTNLRNIGLNPYLVYTIEGVIDMIAACVLAFHRDVRAHCKMLKE